MATPLTPVPHPKAPRTSRRRLRVCQQCDLLITLPALRPRQQACCPRCGHSLTVRHNKPAERSLALALATFISLILSLSFPFLGFEIQGINNHIALTSTVSSLIGFHQLFVALCVLLAVIVLPALYLAAVIWLSIGLIRHQPLPRSRAIARSLEHISPWIMADVFVIGALVSLIKISGMAEISLGWSFWTFCLYAVLLLMTTQSIDSDWMWFSLEGEPLAPEGAKVGNNAATQGLTGCPSCGLVNRINTSGQGQCRRCGERLHHRIPYSRQKTVALLIAAVLLYIPANLYPIMTTTTFGNGAPSTIIGGVLLFFHHGDIPVALVIFIASIVVPIGKILALAWLCYATRSQHQDAVEVARTKLYRVTEFIGRWSMVDVFVVAILVSLIHAGNLLSIEPGPAALAFAAVVILTMLAAINFDPRLIWDANNVKLADLATNKRSSHNKDLASLKEIKEIDHV